MPTYNLPPLKRRKHDSREIDKPNDEWARRIDLPVNKAIADSVSLDDEVEVKLRGKVILVRAQEAQEYSEYGTVIMLDSVTVEPADAEEAEKAFAEGFRKGFGRK